MNQTKHNRFSLRRALILLAVSVLVGPNTLVCQESIWKLIFPPSQRTDAGRIYDSYFKRMMLFGGFTDGRACDDTWFFENGKWTRFWSDPTITLPTARGRFAMCYNLTSREAILFGGFSHGVLFDETWLFKNRWWIKAPLNGKDKPSAREGAAIAFSSHGSDVILFGGKSTSGFENDTWKYKSLVWTKLNTTNAPPARWRHGLVYDPVNREFVLYGGQSAANLNDTWILKGTTWTKISGSGPGARDTFGMVFDSKNQRILLYGGAKKDKPKGDTWEFKNRAWKKITESGPSARAGAAMAYDPDKAQALLYGGWRGTWLLQPDTVSNSTKAVLETVAGTRR